MTPNQDESTKNDGPSSYDALARRLSRTRNLERYDPPAPVPVPVPVPTSQSETPKPFYSGFNNHRFDVPNAQVAPQQPAPVVKEPEVNTPKTWAAPAPGTPLTLAFYGTVYKVLGIVIGVLTIWIVRGLDKLSRFTWFEVLLSLLALVVPFCIYRVGAGLCAAKRNAVYGVFVLLILASLACLPQIFRIGLYEAWPLCVIVALGFVPPLISAAVHFDDLN